uniref:Uncharacterized protein n=1 Tax=Ananas comosus var. bracteatus TaxID=296719 RepID=A0A6V7PPN5_ANACO|nr:unnamed protein product [Ananas comosus var. bracteatus]
MEIYYPNGLESNLNTDSTSSNNIDNVQAKWLFIGFGAANVLRWSTMRFEKFCDVANDPSCKDINALKQHIKNLLIQPRPRLTSTFWMIPAEEPSFPVDQLKASFCFILSITKIYIWSTVTIWLLGLNS